MAGAILGGIDRILFFAREGIEYTNLLPLGQRSQLAVRRQDAELSAGPAGQVSAVRLVFVLRSQVPTPQLALLIQRHQSTIRGKSAVVEGDCVPRENRGAAGQQVLVIVPLKATQ